MAERIKLMIVGESAVGKSSLISQFLNEGLSFTSNHIATLGVETRSKELLLQNRKVMVQVWDTAGVERFATLTKSFYKSADGVLVAFDVSSQRSFEKTSFWLEQVAEGAREGTKTMLVATKSDLQWQVSLADAENLAARFGMPFVITSALKNSNVQEAFLSFSEMVLQSKRSASASVQLSNPKLSKRKRRCCV